MGRLISIKKLPTEYFKRAIVNKIIISKRHSKNTKKSPVKIIKPNLLFLTL